MTTLYDDITRALAERDAALAEANARIAELEAKLAKSADELEKAEQWFDHHAKLHGDKGTRDGDQKAAVNLARSMEMGEAAQEARTTLKATANA